MKKQVFLIALASLITLVACNKNKETQGVAQFTATIEQRAGKTSLDPDNGHINWVAGDQIVIGNDNDETAVFTLQTGAGTNEGGFGTSSEFSTVGPFIAAYPSDAVIGSDKVTFNFPATQTIGETGTFGNGANPMVAYSDDKNLQFKNLCGGLGIRLKGVGAHVTAVRITSKNTSEKLWGAYEVSDCASNEPTLTVASGNQGTNVITLNCNVTLTTAAKTFFVMLPPGTLAGGFTMEVLDGNEVLATKETTSDIALVERNTMKVFNEILIDVEFDGHVEIPTGMSNTDIIITNFSEDAIPDENGDYAIGYSKMLIAKNADNDEPVYFALYSTDFSISKGVTDNVDYQLSAKETALYLALSVFPNGFGELPDNKFHRLKDILYTLDCVQQLEQAVQQSVNQFGYLNEDVFDDALEAARLFFYNELIVPLFGDSGNGRSGLEPPSVNPDHWGNLAKMDLHSSTYNANNDTWDIQTTCWNGMGICVGLVEGSLFDGSYAHYRPEAIVSYLKPTLVSDVFSMDEVFSWQHYVDIYNEVANALHGNSGGFSTIGVAHKDVNFNLYSDENAIFYVGPNHREVQVINFLYLGFQTVKFIVSQLVGSNANEMFNDVLMSSEMALDEHYIGMIDTWSQTHDKELFRTIFFETLRKMGVFWLNHGFFYEEKLTRYNEYTAMLSAVAYACDLFVGYIEFTNYQTIYFEVGGGHQGPLVGYIGYSDLTATSAKVFGIVGNEGAHPVVERGFEWSCIDPQGNAIGGDVVAGSGSGVFSYQFENLYPNTRYDGFVWARHEVGGQKYYGDTYYEFTTLPSGGGGGGGQVPTGAINGLFTINANGDQVYFSQGNLQYQASTNTWRFAEHQWDYVGNANANISSTYSGWIDLFGWGTSGYNHGAVCYQPWSTSQNESDYYAYGSSTYNLYDQTGLADWGNNIILNGGNQENYGWYTISIAEWRYILNTRNTTSGIRYVKGRVNGANGMILLPDDWTTSNYTLHDPNGGSYSSNNISAEDWINILERNGCVFLPASGGRYGTSPDVVGSFGSYWSSTSGGNSAYDITFGSSYYDDGAGRYIGESVRLVCNAQ